MTGTKKFKLAVLVFLTAGNYWQQRCPRRHAEIRAQQIQHEVEQREFNMREQPAMSRRR